MESVRSWRRWMVLAAAIWVQSCAGIGYVFGTLSPVIKTTLGLTQTQLNSLGVAKDLGDSVGLFAGLFSEYLPTSCLLFVGGLQNLLGYGWLWLVVTRRVPTLPFWMICLLIFVGTNGETYFNTAALVSSAQTFPMERGNVVGILKGFAGLSGAIFSQIYAAIYAPDQAAFIFMVAVGPFMVAMAFMFLLKPIVPPKEQRKTRNAGDAIRFNFIYGMCVVIAAYLLGVMIVQDLIDVSRSLISVFTLVLLGILSLPLALPIQSAINDRKGSLQDPLLQDVESQLDKDSKTAETAEAVSSASTSRERQANVNEEKSDDTAKARLEDFQRLWCTGILPGKSNLLAKSTSSADRKKKQKSLGKNFKFTEALVRAEMWLLFFALVCGGGSGLTIIDNMGQITEAKGYPNPHIFVSMISIWNFLGRIAGGYLSEIVARDYAFPRPLTIAVSQAIMAVGQLVYASYLPGCLYGGTLLVGLGYGAHWSIVPATVSEFFGLRNFGAFYNLLTMANPAGSLIFSGIIAGSIYDREAKRQQQRQRPLKLNLQTVATDNNSLLKCKGQSCFFETHLIMAGVCAVGIVLSLGLSYLTRDVYVSLYRNGRGNAKGKAKAKSPRRSASRSKLAQSEEC